MRSLTMLAAMAAFIWQAAPGAAAEGEDAKELGWSIFQKARERAGVAPESEPVHDYTFELMTRTTPPKGSPKQRVEFRSKGYFLAPNLVRQEIQTPKGKVVIIFDGKKGWQMLPNDVRYLPDKAAEQIRAELARSHVLLYEAPAPEQVRFLREEEVEGRKTLVIEIQDVPTMPLRLFVDAETHDVIKKMFVGDTPTGLAQVEEFYSDFREVGGYRWPFVKTILRNGEFARESETTKMQVNVGLSKNDIIR